MKLIRELAQSEAESYVIIGDGPRDRKILSFMSEKFDGKDKLIWHPNEPKGTKCTGLTALNVLPHAVMRYGIKKFLFLIDREHFKKGNQEQTTIQEYLKQQKLSIINISPLISNNSFILSGSIYTKSFELCTVIFGTETNIEEEISRLIKEVYRIQLEPDKNTIEGFLRTKDLKTIIKTAQMKQLESAFPGLCSALKWLEH